MKDTTDGSLLVVEGEGQRRRLSGGPRLEVVERRTPLLPMILKVAADQRSACHAKSARIGHPWLLERCRAPIGVMPRRNGTAAPVCADTDPGQAPCRRGSSLR